MFNWDFLSLIYANSFSNIWYWLLVLVIWGHQFYYIFTVSITELSQAEHNDQIMDEATGRLKETSQKRVNFFQKYDIVIIVLGIAAILSLALISFSGSREGMQALFFILFPLAIIWVLKLQMAQKIIRMQSDTEIITIAGKTRFLVQLIGSFFIILSVFWGIQYRTFLGL